MSDDESKGLRIRLAAAERKMLAWKETALTAQHDQQALLERINTIRYERNLLRRERKAISLTIRAVVDGGGDVADLLDQLASLAQPLRDGEGLLEEEET